MAGVQPLLKDREAEASINLPRKKQKMSVLLGKGKGKAAKPDGNRFGVTFGAPGAKQDQKEPTGVNPELLARLEELEALHSGAAHTAAVEEAPVQAAHVSASDVDLLALYSMIMTDLAWRQGADAQRRAMLNFDLAVDMHDVLKRKPGYVLSEPVLDWLPVLLRLGRPVCVADLSEPQRTELATAQPLWSTERLQAFLASQPRSLLKLYADTRGLLTEQSVSTLKMLQGDRPFDALLFVKS